MRVDSTLQASPQAGGRPPANLPWSSWRPPLLRKNLPGVSGRFPLVLWEVWGEASPQPGGRPPGGLPWSSTRSGGRPLTSLQEDQGRPPGGLPPGWGKTSQRSPPDLLEASLG
eukprot:2235632-Pyramimonas_sp.AAC.1